MKLFLLDAYALIYRAYYAFIKTPRINSKGENTSAIFGFVNTLEDVLKNMQPTHIGVAFDPKGGTFRHRAYPLYKAQREETPEAIRFAVPIIKEILTAYKIPILEVPDYEADDVIGTLALQADRLAKSGNADEEIMTYMMTPDKDYGQLVTDHVKMYRPGTGNTPAQIMGPTEICEKWGINTPSQVIDILGLMGDASDNIPGCPGIGEKTASTLIQTWGSIANLLDNIPNLKGATQRKISDNVEQIKQSHWLVTIATDAPITLNLAALERREPDTHELEQIYTRLEFRQLLKKTVSPTPPSEKPDTRKSRKNTDGSIQGDLFETLGTASDTTVSEPISQLEKYIITDGILIGHDLKRYWQEITTEHPEFTPNPDSGYEEWSKCVFDTAIAHYVLHPEMRHQPDYLQQIYHANTLTELKTQLSDELDRQGLTPLYRDIEMPLMPVLARMEQTGVSIDTAGLAQTSAHFTHEMHQLEQEIITLAGQPFNIASPRQVGEILFDVLKLDTKAKKTKKGQYTTSEEVLQGLQGKHPIVGKILEHRGLKKLLGTYIDAFPKLINPDTGHIHTSFNQTVTTTGRLSSSNPNLQNIPVRDALGKEVRKAFIPESGQEFFSADYSQIELRIMAHLSQDPNLIQAFVQGHDIHAATAAKIFHKDIDEVTSDERRRAKTANFGIIYGISAFGLAERLGCSRSEAKSLIDGYFRTYPHVKDYMNQSIAKARECGYTETLFGRRCPLPDINSHNAVVRGYAERNAINAPIQGTAADIMKIAMINIDRRMQREHLQSHMILQVHDELNFSVLPDEKEHLQQLVIEEMQGAARLSVPLIADAGWGSNWLEAH